VAFPESLGNIGQSVPADAPVVGMDPHKVSATSHIQKNVRMRGLSDRSATAAMWAFVLGVCPGMLCRRSVGRGLRGWSRFQDERVSGLNFSNLLIKY
jgi:hypothetical protein